MLLALALLVASPAIDLAGPWETPGGTVELAAAGDQQWVGKLVEANAACPLPVGTEVLRGLLVDDSLSAQARLCLVSAKCAAEEGTAFSLLLLGVDYESLQGGVHGKAPCAKGAMPLLLRRAHPQPAAPAVAERARPPHENRVKVASTVGGPLPKGPTTTQTTPASPEAPGGPRGSPVAIANAAKLPADTTNKAAAPSTPAPASPAPPAPKLERAAERAVSPEHAVSPERAVSPEHAVSPERPIGARPTDGSYDPRDARHTPPSKARRLLSDGENYIKEGFFEKARKDFLAAVKLDPKLPEAYNGVGVTYYARQDLKSAIEWYKKSLRVDPQFGDGYYNLACAYAVDGQLQAGLAYLKLAASKGYTDLDVIERDPDLEALRGLPEYKDILADVRGP